MRLGITIGRKKGESHFVVITGPKVPLGKQLQDYKEMRGAKKFDDFEEIEVWTSTRGRIRRMRTGGGSVNREAIKPVDEQESDNSARDFLLDLPEGVTIEEQRDFLQSVIDDEESTDMERASARRELAKLPPAQK